MKKESSLLIPQEELSYTEDLIDALKVDISEQRFRRL
jgi:hypothetical protein